MTRRLMRETVMQVLYAYYLQDSETLLIESVAKSIIPPESIKNIPLKDMMMKYLRCMTENTKQIDEYIQEHAKRWELDRMALLDKILIRMGVCEFLFFPDIPTKVSINEMIEIAKKFSTDQSQSFVNGVLDGILRDLKSKNLIQKAERGLVEFSTSKKQHPPKNNDQTKSGFKKEIPTIQTTNQNETNLQKVPRKDR